MTLDEIREDFDLLDDWEDRYRYVIELGRKLPPLPPELRTDTNKVRGCASQVWLASHVAEASDDTGPRLTFEGDSDAHIVKGLIAILFAIYDGKPARDILTTPAEEHLASLRFAEHLTHQRSNVLAWMVSRRRADAAAVADDAAAS